MRKQSGIIFVLIGLLFLTGCGGGASAPGISLPAAGTITEFALLTPMSTPGEITAGPDGTLWFTELVDQIGRMAFKCISDDRIQRAI